MTSSRRRGGSVPPTSSAPPKPIQRQKRSALRASVAKMCIGSSVPPPEAASRRVRRSSHCSGGSGSRRGAGDVGEAMGRIVGSRFASCWAWPEATTAGSVLGPEPHGWTLGPGGAGERGDGGGGPRPLVDQAVLGGLLRAEEGPADEVLAHPLDRPAHGRGHPGTEPLALVGVQLGPLRSEERRV